MAGKKAKVNGNQKGKRGEREFAAVLKTHGLSARRGQQFAGGTDSPDVVCNDLTGVHFEVKRIQASKVPYEWLGQAKRDAGGKLPIVAHRQNNLEWIAILPMKDLIELLLIREGLFL